jgi:hypothetical protein
MWSFFHGWRRKAGVATLVMALAFTGFWIRSRTTVDMIVTPPFCEARLLFGSFHEGIRPGITFEKSDFFLPPSPLPSSLAIRNQLFGVWFTFPRDNLWWEGHPRIAHWSVAVPLTLLSAYLLLVPSRKRPPTESQPHA